MRSAITLAGRRTDAVGATLARFPLANVGLVRDRVRDLFQKRDASALFCAAACGADLTALEVAEALRIPAWVVLPFATAHFRESSVVDRPGDWGPVYDRQIRNAQEAGRLIVHAHSPDRDATYLQANEDILDAAVKETHSQGLALRAAIVWDGRPRTGTDITEAFAHSARARSLPVDEVLTL